MPPAVPAAKLPEMKGADLVARVAVLEAMVVALGAVEFLGKPEAERDGFLAELKKDAVAHAKSYGHPLVAAAAEPTVDRLLEAVRNAAAT